MIDYQNYHTSPLFVSSKEGTEFKGLSFKTTRNTTHPFHFHDGVELMYVHKGAILVNAFHLVEMVKEGQFIAHDPYIIHSVESMTADTVVTTINISGDYIDDNDGVISSNIHRAADTTEYAQLKEDIFEWIMMANMPGVTTKKMLWQMKKIFPRLQKVMSLEIWDTKENNGIVQVTEKDHERLTRVLNYLFLHHDETISLDTVSSELYISKYYLSHYMKKTLGYTLKQALLHCRMEESMIDLLGGQMTTEEIAVKHGFSSVRSYNEAFPRYLGVSPAEYRRRHQKETILYKDFVGEVVSLDAFDSKWEEESARQPAHACSVTISLSGGDYEVLYVETEKNNISNRIARLDAQNRNLKVESDCEELILRIKKQHH